jgi:LuxR family maltose regulon positive regulatory protein
MRTQHRSGGDPVSENPVEPRSAGMPNGDPVLAARFAVPAVHPSFLRRPRLAERLTEGVRLPLTLINGPAGAGKTQLAADWLSLGNAPGPVAWLTTEPSDDAPGNFWAYVLEALRHAGLALPPGFGSPAHADDVDPSLLVRLASWLSGRDDPAVLVLDEYDHVQSAQIARHLHDLLRHCAGRLRLILIGRSEPPLPLYRYSAAGQLAQIRAADLAFRVPETTAVLRRHGLDLPVSVVEALNERIGGWAAGLCLLALAARHADDPETYLKDFDTRQTTLADFLLTEVLEAQPAQTQDLLLRTSILERTHPDLADALTGREDGRRILAALQRANAFIEPLGHDWYRHHPLFGEILRLHLRAWHPGLEEELHRRAARWLADAGLHAPALKHAAASDAWEFAAGHFVGQLAIGRLFAGRDCARLRDLFGGMPPGVRSAASDLVRAALHLARYDVRVGTHFLNRAEQQLPPDDAALQLTAAYLRVLAGRLLCRVSMAETAAGRVHDFEQQVEQRTLQHHPELTAMVEADLGSALLWEGRLDEARRPLTAAANAAGGSTTAYTRHESLCRLALIDFLQGWPTHAERHVGEAVAEAERSSLPVSSRTEAGNLVLAATAVDRDELRAAGETLERVSSSDAARNDPLMEVGVGIVRCNLLIAEGDAPAALRVLSQTRSRALARQPSAWIEGRVAVAESAAHLAADDPRAAVQALERAPGGAPDRAVAAARACLAAGRASEQKGRSALLALKAVRDDADIGPAVRTRALLASAQFAAHRGEKSSAGNLVGRALAVAAPDRLRRPFLEAGAWLEQLLRDRPELARAHPWLPDRLSGGGPAADGAERPDPEPLIEPLSAREREVLDLAAQMLSTEEIAASLFVSANTIKTHLKNINRKLATTRRSAAVRKARQHRIL